MKLIKDSFGSDWMENPYNAAKVRDVRCKALNLKYQWKTKSLARISEHVEAITKDQSWDDVDVDSQLLNNFFLRCWSIEKAQTLFYWATPAVDFTECSERAQRFLCG